MKLGRKGRQKLRRRATERLEREAKRIPSPHGRIDGSPPRPASKDAARIYRNAKTL